MDNKKFGNLEYWDDRYKNEEEYDWFCGYDKLRDILLKYVHKDDLIMNLGCGNSGLSISMVKDGFKHILNLDYSKVIIEKLENTYSHCPYLYWQVADIRQMHSFASESYDVIIEKGTLDVLMVREKDPWMMSKEAEQDMTGVLTQISRILKPGGRFISITFAQPHFRMPCLARQQYNWDICIETIGTCFHYFVYVMSKGRLLTDKNLQYVDADNKRKMIKECLQVEQLSSDDEDYLLKGILI